MAVVASPGQESGMMIDHIVRSRLAPSMSPASSSSGGSCRKKPTSSQMVKRHREREVRQNESGVRVEESKLAQQQVERRHDRDLRKHGDREHDGQRWRFPAKPQTRQRVGTGRAESNRQDGGGAGHDQRVADGHPEVQAAEQRAVVIEHERARQQRRRLEEPSLGSERGDDRPVQREDNGRHQQRGRDRPAPNLDGSCRPTP